ncbi:MULTISPECIES: BadF/BadG/BcrA/BcrD ATPase family protein [unclassified Streptomyces]|uniref:N-acetylglucosamine kinase n=1 Tax=Streptomyces TaxID=1883 RepID=UPI0001C1D033|nr:MULTISPECIES: BadF/BadG/BcrA/BcrD ATPase family protein [unclassified Streptomyces]MYR67612.1 ATPase [Streptomyces sp. SID4939]MYS00418.1 ATPase [Streptomyces sp. SID4940]MYT65014.1 ATPase [Streptomyces sp. SID8357]MYT88977.1 ATPase [Streptomyces sp. SID8360]MYU36605.1 ATPase [Streptomyces sp. SID8358]MYW37469.1 ATPase [Streptomyces sp. SID1]MYX76675.1 ATPase [Streptomyces sp. SID3915]
MGVNASVLAVDAGNSKTDVALIGEDGSVLSTARGGGFQPPVVGVRAAVDALAVAVTQALARAGEHVDGVRHVSACLANADLPVEEAELAEALLGRGWGRTVEVRNDTFAILRAGVDEPRGVAVVCGAGINCVGMGPDGRTARFPAIGRISGDWGGGSGLAEEALWFAARAEDGRGEPTELVRTLPGHFGLGSMYELIEALHRGRVPQEARHELTPVLFATSAAGDPVASALVDRLADEVVAMASVALGRLGLLDEEVPVLLGGSVLAARHPRLDERIGALLAARAPKAVIRVVAQPPVLGAGLLGLDHLGAPPEVRNRLRAHYA